MLRPADSEVKRPQAPEWMALPERSTMLALRSIAWVALALGRPLARLLLYPISLYFVMFSSRPRTASRQFLSRVLGRKAGIADTFRHYHTFAAVILDRLYLLKDQISRFDVRVHGSEIVEDLIAGGKGCVLLGAHMGSFEIIRSAGRARGFKVSMVMYEGNARKIRKLLEAINPALQMEVIGLGSVDSMLKVEAALARGEIVGLLADRTIKGGGTVSCPFMGEQAAFPVGPVRIAAMLKRPVALMFGIYRGGNRYEVHFERLAELDQIVSRDRDSMTGHVLRRYAERLEHYCRIAPYNWFNFYDFWR
jgi:predicted LPLAT superfamily acyltransferase